MDIADLVVWTYQVQAADRVYDDGLWSTGGRSGDSCCRVMRRAASGCRIDGGGWRGLGRLHPDAETVHECVLAMSASAAMRIMRFGRSGCIPGYLGDATIRLRARRLKGGRPAWIKDEGGRVIGVELAEVVMRGGVEAEEVPIGTLALACEQYARWRQDLCALVQVLRQRPVPLVNHRVTGPAATERPWEAVAARCA